MTAALGPSDRLSQLSLADSEASATRSAFMDLGVIRCNDAEVLMDLEDLAERRINNLHAFNKRRGSESLSLRHTFHFMYLSH